MRVLLLHGFTGHPDDLAPLDQAFSAAGYECKRPALPGHACESPQAIERFSANDWIRFTQEQEADVIVGLSMGGLLSVIAAAKRPPQKLILLSPAFYLRTPGKLLALAANCGLGSLVRAIPKAAGSDIAEPKAKAASKAYREISLKALREFDAVRRQALAVLPTLKIKPHVFFGAHDHTVDTEASAALFDDSVILGNSAHILPVDYDQKELIKQCLAILAE